MILLDSSIIIDHFRKTNKTKTPFFKLASENNILAISTITEFEISVGNTSLHRYYWENLLEDLHILPFDSSCCNVAIEIHQGLKKSNKLIGLADLIIGSTAIVNNISLATLNVKHFRRIEGIKLLSI